MTGKERFYNLIESGRLGKNIGLSIGLPKMENCMDGFLPGTSYLIAAQSGTGNLNLFGIVWRCKKFLL